MLYPTLWRANTASLWDDLANMRRDFDRFLGAPSSAGGQILSAWVPAVDVRESADEYHVSAELPGLRPEDINVTVQNNVLTISGEKRQEAELGQEDGSNYHFFERRYGKFERSFTLPRTVAA